MRHPLLHAALAASLMAATMLAGCDRAGDNRAAAIADFGVRGAVLRLNPNPAAPSAAYFTLAAGNEARVLTGATSNEVEHIEMHETMAHGGMTSMQPLDRVEIPAHGETVFAPGGRHMMLFGLSDEAKAAGTLTIDLHFADGAVLPVAFAFDPVGGDANVPASGEPAAPAAPSAATGSSAP